MLLSPLQHVVKYVNTAELLHLVTLVKESMNVLGVEALGSVLSTQPVDTR